MDGKGVKNENVTDYRYALVESDCMALEEQNAIIRELELPVAVLVYSGGKSVHAIVKIDAANYDEYRKRIDYLYNVCRKNGFEIDKQNRNPSRLSRMPGVIRNGKKQFIIDTNIGKSDFPSGKTGWRVSTTICLTSKTSQIFFKILPNLLRLLLTVFYDKDIKCCLVVLQRPANLLDLSNCV